MSRHSFNVVRTYHHNTSRFNLPSVYFKNDDRNEESNRLNPEILNQLTTLSKLIYPSNKQAKLADLPMPSWENIFDVMKGEGNWW